MPTTSVSTKKAAEWFHALADETRLEIVGQLLGGERCVCELTDTLDTQQSRLSFHLKTLKDAGVITDRREGRWVYYALDRDALEEITALTANIASTHRSPRRRNVCCE